MDGLHDADSRRLLDRAPTSASSFLISRASQRRLPRRRLLARGNLVDPRKTMPPRIIRLPMLEPPWPDRRRSFAKKWLALAAGD
jgi:hypothetical protein